MAAEVLELGTDIGLRRQWMIEASFEHPAKLHLGLLQIIIDRYSVPGDTLLDPMAGIGGILLAATMQRNVIAREIEPKWLEVLHQNAALVYARSGLLAGHITVSQADAREPWGVVAKHIVFSPPYGCRVSPHAGTRVGMLSIRIQKAKDAGTSYGELWDRILDNPGANGAFRFHYGDHPAQVGHLRNAAYWDAMRTIYSHAYAALGSGVMVLIIKDHIRHGQRVTVAEDTVALCESLGFRLVERFARLVHPLSLWQRRRKERSEPIVEEEDVVVFRRAVP